MLETVYLISSLPSLSFGDKPTMSMEQFMQDAGGQLSKKSYGKLEHLDIGALSSIDSNANLKSFAVWLTACQEDIAVIRNARKHKQVPNMATLPKTILDDNPLEREKAIMKLQWDELTSLELGESFTLTEVLIYKLKLQILHRLNSFNTEKGAEVFASVVNPQEN